MPQAAPVLLAKPDSVIAKRGAFATKNLWVTPHADEVLSSHRLVIARTGSLPMPLKAQRQP